MVYEILKYYIFLQPGRTVAPNIRSLNCRYKRFFRKQYNSIFKKWIKILIQKLKKSFQNYFHLNSEMVIWRCNIYYYILMVEACWFGFWHGKSIENYSVSLVVLFIGLTLNSDCQPTLCIIGRLKFLQYCVMKTRARPKWDWDGSPRKKIFTFL